MRENSRIHTFTNRLDDLWLTRVPDWRFGQLMFNFFSYINTDPFYIEDEEMLRKLEQFLDGYKPRRQ